jgi:glycosyltransferase involved in cell wall biosynthesis
MTISAIIPVRNELGNVNSLLLNAHKIKVLKQIIVIDGRSTDGTLEAAKKMAFKLNDARVSVISQEHPFGKFQAIQQASEKLLSDSVVIWDGDNTIKYSDVEEIIDEYMTISQTKKIIIVANRLTLLRDRDSFRLINLLGNYIYSFLMRLVLVKHVPDVLSGVKIFPTKLIDKDQCCEKLLERDIYGDFTILSLSVKHGIDITSIPVSYSKRIFGKTKVSRLRVGVNLLYIWIHLLVHKCYKVSHEV